MKKNKLAAGLILVVLVFNTLFGSGVGAVDAKDSEIGYRMKPLQELLVSMSSQDIDTSISGFKDLKTHWSRKQVGKLVLLEIIASPGVSDFYPDSLLQADQYIKMLVCAMGFKVESNKTNWAKPYIDIAVKYGLVKAGEIAQYARPITRELMVKILVRADLQVDAAPGNIYDDYIIGKLMDYNKISDNCKQAVLDAMKLGLASGANNLFNPKSSLTRAEGASVVLRFLDVKERKPVKPGVEEVLKIKTNMGEWMELYPGRIPETFTVAKAVVDNVSKAKGYVSIGYNPENCVVFANFHESKEAWEADCINSIGSIQIDYKHKNTYAFVLDVNDSLKYKDKFNDYAREVLKVMYYSKKGKTQAIALHDKYMNAIYKRIDGLNDYTETTIDNRLSLYLRYNQAQFGMQLKLVGEN